MPADPPRSLAVQIAATAAVGAGPGGIELTAREARAVTELAKRYLEEDTRPKKKPSSPAQDERLFEKCILPHLGRLRVPEVSSADLRTMHHALRKTPVQENRASCSPQGS